MGPHKHGWDAWLEVKPNHDSFLVLPKHLLPHLLTANLVPLFAQAQELDQVSVEALLLLLIVVDSPEEFVQLDRDAQTSR